MNEAALPIWYLGRDDDLIRQHLGTDDLSIFYNPRNWPRGPTLWSDSGSLPTIGRYPQPEPWAGTVPRPSGPKSAGFGLKHAIKTYKLGVKLYKFGQVASRFTFGENGRLVRFQKNMLGGSRWKWKSVRYEGNRRFRTRCRTPIFDGVDWKKGRLKHLEVHHRTYSASSSQAKKLGVSVAVFDKKGLWKGAKSDFKWALAEMGAVSVWKVYEGFTTGRGWEPVRDYVLDPIRLWELAKAVVKGAITGVLAAGVTTAATAALPAVASFAIIPIAVGLVATVAVGCLVDAAFGDECIVQSAWRWLNKPPPAAMPPTPPLPAPPPPPALTPKPGPTPPGVKPLT